MSQGTQQYNKIQHLMAQYPVVKNSTGSIDHAQHAVEQALVDRVIDASEYHELIGYVLNKMFR